ncbi:DinB family protein [Pedobacter sp. L105]|uniref:DinB family protein n=1 Tax=Pedobacter sp. L105 TaxID=1641871 RepID=UPI00131CC367|nr:DinB family protein [Pedobacter sp. L105]
MSTLKEFLKELHQESKVTRKMLERIPADKYEWQPHVKSMTIRRLSSHLEELPQWITMAFTTNELNFATVPYEPVLWKDNLELLDIFERSLAEATMHLEKGKEEELNPTWLLKNGDQVLVTMTKRELVRHAISQTIHHRAQLGVFLRLLDVPIPASYGPSADENEF